MPRLHVIGRDFDLTDEAAAPLIAADILYWDTMGGDDGEEPPHLHINPELPGFGQIESTVHEHGPSALRDAKAFRLNAMSREAWMALERRRAAQT